MARLKREIDQLTLELDHTSKFLPILGIVGGAVVAHFGLYMGIGYNLRESDEPDRLWLGLYIGPLGVGACLIIYSIFTVGKRHRARRRLAKQIESKKKQYELYRAQMRYGRTPLSGPGLVSYAWHF